MNHHRELSGTVIYGPWHFVEAAVRHRCLQWIGLQPNPIDGSIGSDLVNDADDTVNGIRVLDFFYEVNGVQWEVVTPTSNRGRSFHEIILEQGTTSDRCLITWVSEYEEDCSSAEIEATKRRNFFAFEEVRHIVHSCQRMSSAHHN